jgi:hypothetical protein
VIDVVSQTNNNSTSTTQYVVEDNGEQFTVTYQYADDIQTCTCGAGSCVHIGIVNEQGCTCGVCDFCLSVELPILGGE